MSQFLLRPAQAARFDPARYAKLDLARGDHLLLGLNCFEPGQAQSAHTHAGADKFYVVLSGKASMRIGAEQIMATAGDVVWAPAGELHGVDAALERTVMLVGITPPP